MYILSFILGFVQFALMGYIIIIEVKKKSPAVYFWVTLFVMFGIPHLITTIFENVNYSSVLLLKASVFVCVFCLLYLMVRVNKKVSYITLAETKGLKLASTNLSSTVFEHFCYAVFLVSIIGYIFHVIFSSGGLLETSWESIHYMEERYVNIYGLA